MAEARRPGALDARDAGELLHAVVTDVGEAMDLWSVDLWAVGDAADTLECRAYWCRDGATAGGGFVGAVVGLDQSHDLRRLVLTAEVVERHLDDDLSPTDAAALAQAGFTTRIDVPLLAGAEVLGILSLCERRAIRRLMPEERARLATLARLAAAVLRATRLYEAESERAERLAALLVAGRGLSSLLSTADIVAAVRKEATQLVAGVACDAEVVLRQDDGTFMRVAGPEADGALTVWRADALARQAVRLARPEQMSVPGGRARLVLPLGAGERVAGCLELTATLGRRFRDSEIELAMLIAGQAADALERSRAIRALQGRTATDTLTGLYSRWYFYERLYAEVARALRYRQPLSLVMAELDDEQELARSRSGAFRDAVLVGMARLLQTSLRDKVDIACRLRGGRFALLLPNTPQAPEAAGLVAERIRLRVAGTRLSDDELGALGRFTMSLGVAGFPDAAEDADELASIAEARLERALAAGGDRVEPPLPEPDDDDGADEGDGAPEDEPA